MPRHRSAAAAVAVAVVVAATAGACSDADGDTPTTTTTAATTTTATTVPDLASVELLDAGTEPRQELRLALEAGTRVTVRHRTDLELVQRGGAAPQRLDPPAVTYVVAYVVRSVDAGVATVDAVIDDVETDDAELRTALEGTLGTRTSFQVDDRGRSSTVAFVVPADAPATLRAQLRRLEDQASNLGPLLPAEPIGVGARWTTTVSEQLDGVTTTTTTTFTATEVGTDELGYESTISIATASGDLSGRGRGTMPLRSLGATWEATVEGAQEVTIGDGPQAMTLTQDLTIATAALPSEPL